MPLEGILNWWKNWNSKRVNDRMVENAPPTPVIIVGTMGSSGETIFGDSATAGPKLAVLDDNSTSIESHADANVSALRHDRVHHLFGVAPHPSTGQWTNAAPRRFQTTLTATAGGEITAAAVGPPALSSYQCCMVITHLWSDQTDASIAMSITSTGGLTVGPASWAWATVANDVTDYTPGVFFQATADNDTIDVSCAAGQAQANQVVEVHGVYWYET